MSKCLIEEASAGFQFEGRLVSTEPNENGHINDTFLLRFIDEDGKEHKRILQRMNKSVFKQPVELMENIMNVTSYLQNIIDKNGGDPKRETLNVIPALDGKPYYCDS